MRCIASRVPRRNPPGDATLPLHVGGGAGAGRRRHHRQRCRCALDGICGRRHCARERCRRRCRRFLHGARPSARASATSRERGGAGLYFHRLTCLYFHRLTCLYFHRLMFTKYTPVYKPRRPQSTDWRGGPVFMNVQNTKAPNVFNERSEQHPSRVLGSSAMPQRWPKQVCSSFASAKLHASAATSARHKIIGTVPLCCPSLAPPVPTVQPCRPMLEIPAM